MTRISDNRVFDRALHVGLRELEENAPGSVDDPLTTLPRQRRLATILLAAGVAVCVGGWFALQDREYAGATATAPTEQAERVGVWQDPKQQDPKKPATVTLRFRNMDGAAAIMDVARAGRLNVVIHGEIKGSIEQLKLGEVPAAEALAAVVRSLGAEAVPAGGPLVRVQMPPAEPKPQGPLHMAIERSRLRDVVTLIQKLGHPVVLEKELDDVRIDMKGKGTALDLLRESLSKKNCLVLHQGKALYLRPAGDGDPKIARIRFHFRDADVATVAGTIAKASGTNVVVPPTKRKVSLSFYDLTWPRALEALARAADMELHMEKPNLFRFVKPQK